MNKALAGTIVGSLLALAAPAWAGPITLEFSSSGVPPGDNGGLSYISVFSPTIANGSNLGVGLLTVTGSPSEDGTYAITGAVNGFGSLSFDTSTNQVSIVGGVPILGVSNGTTLLLGDGSPFTDVSVTAPACTGIPSHTCPTVSFDASDTIASSLLASLGLSGGPWDVNTFAAGEGTGNGFPEASADALSTKVPEPATLSIFGIGLVIGGVVKDRRNKRKASLA